MNRSQYLVPAACYVKALYQSRIHTFPRSGQWRGNNHGRIRVMGVNEGRPPRPPPSGRSPRGPPRRYIWGIDGRGAHATLSQPKPPEGQARTGAKYFPTPSTGLAQEGLGHRTDYRTGLWQSRSQEQQRRVYIRRS